MDRGAWRATVHEVAKEPDTTEQLNCERVAPKSSHPKKKKTWNSGWGWMLTRRVAVVTPQGTHKPSR